jgi:CheY-like chemotaxis protein
VTSGTGRTILVVEDCDEDFDTVATALRLTTLPHRIVRAMTGDECLDLLRAEIPRVRPDLVILDLNTPGGDALDALHIIRADSALHSLPVVVMSTSSNPRDVVRSYVARANAYHVKPLRHADHLRVLGALLAYWLSAVTLPPVAGSVQP